MKSIDVERVIEYIRENIENDITLDDIAKHMNYSRFYLSRTFKKEKGASIKQYIEALKVESNNFVETKNSFSIKVKYPVGYKHKITCMGLFKEALPKGAPVVGVASADVLEFTIENVPNCKYYFFACEIMEDISLTKSYVLNNNYRMGLFEPFTFEGQTHHSCEIMMRRKQYGDPPITINLPALLNRTFTNKIKYEIRKKFLFVYD